MKRVLAPCYICDHQVEVSQDQDTNKWIIKCTNCDYVSPMISRDWELTYPQMHDLIIEMWNYGELI